jgi:elongation factor Ts
MVDITAKMVKDLRAATGAGPLDCKKALQENNGDVQKAIDYLREKGMASANKKLGKERTMNEGVVVVFQNDDKTLGAMAAVNCETDFVSSNEIFQRFAQNVVEHVANQNPTNVEELMAQPFYADGGSTIEEMMKQTIADIGEKVQIGSIARFEAPAGGIVEIYQHFNKQTAAMVAVTSADAQQVAYDIAMHISNLKPAYLVRDDVPAEVIEHERQVQLNRAVEEGKPEHIAQKVVDGRMGKFYEEIVLLEQPFLKDDSKTIAALLEEAGTEVTQMARFAMGESDNDEGDE